MYICKATRATWPRHAVLCAERAIGEDTFAVLLADDFITDQKPGPTADLINAYQVNGKSQLSVMEVDGPDISKYGVVVPDDAGTGIMVLLKNQLWKKLLQN